ncbi:MAG TPA: CDP-alcohol phosphatidyltransferase family protein [Afifellaceae bacterium]|nr:CDP-alcohol phosphatidyltransferase family protein [Afifellaceae bacterium]
MTIPNFISIARLLLVPAIVYLMITEREWAAGLLFAIAGISDAVDGFIAKRFGMTSELGKYLDPIADKALLVSVFVTFGLQGALPLWLIILVVSRDILITGAVMLAWVMGNPIKVQPLVVSKLNTATQIVLIIIVFAVEAGLALLTPVIPAVVLVVAALTIVSAGAYLVDWMRHMAEAESEQTGHEDAP